MTFDPKEARALVERLEGYTPGPWRIGSRHTENGVYTEAGDLVAGTHSTQRNVGRDEQIKEQDNNAALISAAPDLHAALTAALDEIERLREALQAGYDLIEGDATGADWKRGCRVFTGQARAALKGDDQ